MKIAFVGKGGSGKSTVGALFTKYITDQGRSVLAVDADINQHFAELIGAPFDPRLALGDSSNMQTVRSYLRGSNQLIENEKKFVKTTPPGAGSNLITIDAKNEILTKFSTKFSEHGYFMHVGTYKEGGIGTSCYHSDLAIFENVLSHTKTGSDWLITDMVAGTDAFAGALYLLFDVIFMVVEPTPESLGVYGQFKKLAIAANVYDRVFVVGNKIFDDQDTDYIRQHVGDKLIAVLEYDPELRKKRQTGKKIEALPSSAYPQMQHIEEITLRYRPDPQSQLAKLGELHEHFASQGFTIAKHGDLKGQVDKSFNI